MHLIIDGIDTVYTPADCEFADTWHGLQRELKGGIQPDGSNSPDVFCPLVQCGIKADFETEVAKDLPEELASHLGEQGFKDWKLILADLRQGQAGKVIPVHIPRKGYQIHQNKLLFDTFVASANEVLGPNGYTIATLGTLGAYSQFFISIAIKGNDAGFTIGKGDKWATFYNLVSSHNGLVASQRHLSMVRIVCMNTVQAAIASAECQAMLKHTKNSLELITPQVFAKDLKNWLGEKEQFQQTLEALKAQAMDVDGFRAFASGVFTNDGSDNLSTTSFNRVTEMESLFARGKGNKGKSVYDAVNSFTEYFTSGNGVGSKDRVALNKRIASANFGRGNQWKLEALRCASEEEVFKTTMERGERYYTDKLAVDTAKAKAN